MTENDRPLKLDPDAVRRRASSIPGCVEVPIQDDLDKNAKTPPKANNKTTEEYSGKKFANTVVFLVGLPERGALAPHDETQEKDVAKLARITVYCDTGTIATGRYLQATSSVRHTFRRNVSNLDAVERCLRHPAELSSIDWQLVGLADGDVGEGDATLSDDRAGPPDDEIRIHSSQPRRSVEHNLELVDVGMAILQCEKEKLDQHLTSLEEEMRKEEGSERTSTSAASTGMEFLFSLAPGPMKHVDQCLNDITKMGKIVRCVATNGAGTVFLYGHGGVAYTPHIPRQLYHKLSQLRSSRSHAHRPAYVALGTQQRYFVAFHDKTFAYKGHKQMDRELRKVAEPPLSVAFGGPYDTFFLVFHDGSWKYQGRGIPDELEEKLQDRNERSDLQCVNLGPGGEWFLRARNGRMWWGGISDEADEAVQELIEDGHTLNFLDFGEDGSYFVSYD